MIRAPHTSPQAALAEALDATIIGPSTIELPDHRLVTTSPLGVVRVDGRPVGLWHDATETLAARVRAAVTLYAADEVAS